MSSILLATHLGGKEPEIKMPKNGLESVVIPNNYREVWRPIGTAQALALTCPSSEVLFQGTRGGGKTDVALMRFRVSVGLGYGEFWRGMMYDVQFSALDDIVQRAKRWFYQFDDGCKFYSSKADYKFVWKTGEELLFRALANEDDYQNKVHGMEFAYLSPNEICKHSTPDLYDLVLSTNRTSFVARDYPKRDGTILPELPMCVFSTCNPSGAGKWWVKKRFIDAGARGEIVKSDVELFDPREQKRVTVTRTKCHIFSSYKENTKLSSEYVAQLEQIEDSVKRDAWLLGLWTNDGDGGRFDRIWDSEQHIIDEFDIPLNWTIKRSFDWGSSHPFSVLWFAENTTGEDIKLRNGKTKSSIRGDIFMIHEWHGSQPDKPNKGLKLLATEIAKGIIERELSWGIHSRVLPGNADTAIWNVENGNSIAVDMMKPITIGNKVYQGVHWLRSDKKPGSRVAGWYAICNYLDNAKITKSKPYRESAGLFIFKDCKMFIDVFPSLQRDRKNPEDIDSDSNDHCADSLRYFIYGLKTGSKSGKTQGLT